VCLDEATGKVGHPPSTASRLKAIDPPATIQGGDGRSKMARRAVTRRAAILTAEGFKQSLIVDAATMAMTSRA